MIPLVDFEQMLDRDPAAMDAIREGAMEVGFFLLTNTPLTPARITRVLDTYRQFFLQPEDQKAAVDMARTGSNRGWGAPGSEKVDPNANADYKQVFDIGFELPANDPVRDEKIRFYADNQWPDGQEDFRAELLAYYAAALKVARQLIAGVAHAIGQDEAYFANKFTRPMALLRGNYYPPRPPWAGPRDFGIATHTDYGCLTLLALDGTPGLEVRKRGGGWIEVNADPGTFAINFGEMMQMWTGGRVRATPHRVVGTDAERLSVPLFVNPNHDVNVAPEGADPIRAGDHLAKRFEETYLHLSKASD